jgi:cell shape-determining protein MreC
VSQNYKEIATKVVELQRTVMSLRGKLKQKESVEDENARLREEIGELRARNVEQEKRRTKQ